MPATEERSCGVWFGGVYGRDEHICIEEEGMLILALGCVWVV
jgi:hypothetical protein